MPRIVEKVINPLVGLSAEAIAHHRNKSRTPSRPSNANLPTTTALQRGNEFAASPSPQTLDDTDIPSEYASEYASDSEDWALDDEAAAASSAHREEDISAVAPSGFSGDVPKGNWAGPASIEDIVNAFLARYPSRNDPSVGDRLELPVIIPQRRPHTKMRGFVKAYAPILADAGISQEAWMAFLESFEQAIKVRPRAVAGK